MRRVLTVLAATAALLPLAAPAGAATDYTPGQYTAGPKGGDASTYTEADPASGKVVIFQRNTRQAAAVHCIGDGPRATLVAAHPVTGPASSVVVNYADAFMTAHPVIDVLVTGSKSDWLGHGNAFGPKTNESGAVTIPLSKTPEVGETLTIQFGLQLHAGCLGHPTLLGLQGSRPVEGAQVMFTSVSVG